MSAKNKTLIIYDSLYGNTEKIAKRIQKNISGSVLKHINSVKNKEIAKYDLIILGCPTQGGRPTSDISYFLENNSASLNGKQVAVFDTRFDIKDLSFLLKLLVRSIDYAAPKLAQIVINNNGKLASEPIGFYVSSKTGPLKQGEMTRAAIWAKKIITGLKTPKEE